MDIAVSSNQFLLSPEQCFREADKESRSLFAAGLTGNRFIQNSIQRGLAILNDNSVGVLYEVSCA
jgi:hypothetical protein